MISRPLILVLLCVAGVATASAQPNSPLQGTVVYDVAVQLDRPALPRGLEDAAVSLPREMRTTRRLRFQGDVAITDNVTTATTSAFAPASEFYVDYGSGTRVSQLYIEREAFLIEAPTERVQWRVTGEEGEYLGYPVLKATAAVDARVLEAWFTPAIPAPLGPDLYYGLPGLILVLTEDEGKKTVHARSVSLAALADPVVPPARGRPVSTEEYVRLVREHVDAMQRALQESAEVDG